MPKKMTVSQKGLDFLKSFEGEVLRVYDDGFGYLTCGVGHRVLPADGLKKGQKITAEQSRVFLEHDVALHCQPIDRLVTVSLNQNQYDALASLVFNIGGENFKHSTVLAKLNAGDYPAAAAAFGKFNKARKHGKLVVVEGLTRRRAAERELFLS